ncbi:MAG: helix-turn-helix domain-containing protein [Firmicutes bacterium]|nr:helix-turn-helix domain-containing protein [Candidatus Colivicinus equi]
MNIKEIRLNKKLTQQQAADIIGLSLRTYQNYESGASSRDKFKIDNIVRILNEYEKYTETKGIIPIEELIEKCEPIFTKYNLKYVYLFGSYAKNKASEKSDIDLMISDEAKGFDFIDLQENLHQVLHKNIDLIRIDDLKNNKEFLNEVLATGVKIYGNKHK